MSLIFAAVSTALGALLGHLARRSVPPLIGLRDRSLPFRGPGLEVATAIFFGATALHLGTPSSAWPFLVALTLLTIAACDYFVKLIPDRLSLPLTLAACGWAAYEPRWLLDMPLQRWLLLAAAPQLQGSVFEGPVLAVLGALFGALALETIRRTFGLLAGLEVMGLGDTKLAMALGAILGPVGLLMSLPLAFVLGVVHGLLYLRLTGQPHSPFGPSLALAGYLTLLFHPWLVSGLGRLQRLVLALPLGLLAALYTILIAVAVFLVWRTRQKAAEYEAIIEEDYRR
ncbi:MAG: A24 family peptidase, partial [Acidobacteriota bacterium]